MKNALLLLLFLNIVVLLWYNWVDESPLQTVQQPTIIPDEPEPPAAQPSPKQVPSPEPSVEQVSGRLICFVSEPVASTESVASYQQAIQDRGLAVTISDAEARILMGQWVRVEGLEGRAAARQVARSLREQGIAEGYALPDSEQKGLWLVSLGIFKNAQSAEKLAQRANSAGFRAVVRPRFEAAPGFVLSFSAAPAVMDDIIREAGIAGQVLECSAK